LFLEIVSAALPEPVLKSLQTTFAVTCTPRMPPPDAVTDPSWAVSVVVPVLAEPRLAFAGTLTLTDAWLAGARPSRSTAKAAPMAPSRRNMVRRSSDVLTSSRASFSSRSDARELLGRLSAAVPKT
jgi:hypothetical protein